MTYYNYVHNYLVCHISKKHFFLPEGLWPIVRACVFYNTINSLSLSLNTA